MTKAEADVAQVRERIARDQAMLDAGSVASARQLEDLQHEIGNLARRVSDLEDAELEVMESLRTHRCARRRRPQPSTSLRRAATGRRACSRCRLRGHRSRGRAGRRRTGAGGAGDPSRPAGAVRPTAPTRAASAAPLHRGLCQGCQITLTPADLGKDPVPSGRRGRALRGVPADPRAHRRACLRGTWSSRPTAGRGATPVRLPTGPSCSTRTGEILVELADYLGIQTNNVAEYEGATAGLVAAQESSPRPRGSRRGWTPASSWSSFLGGWAIKNAKLRLRRAPRRWPRRTGSGSRGFPGRRTSAPMPWPTSRWTPPPPAARRRSSVAVLAVPVLDIYVDVADHLGAEAQAEAEAEAASEAAQAPGSWVSGAVAAEAGAAQIRATLLGEPAVGRIQLSLFDAPAAPSAPSKKIVGWSRADRACRRRC